MAALHSLDSVTVGCPGERCNTLLMWSYLWVSCSIKKWGLTQRNSVCFLNMTLKAWRKKKKKNRWSKFGKTLVKRVTKKITMKKNLKYETWNSGRWERSRIRSPLLIKVSIKTLLLEMWALVLSVLLRGGVASPGCYSVPYLPGASAKFLFKHWNSISSWRS